MDTETIAELNEYLDADWSTTLVPLSDKAFTRTRVADSKADDRLAG